MQKTLPNRAIEWQDQQLILLDQRLLPNAIEFIRITTVQEAIQAIRNMVVRGAPAIGITAAYAVVLSGLSHQSLAIDAAIQAIEKDIQRLSTARPTAVNLNWALQRMRTVLSAGAIQWLEILEQEAMQIHTEDIAANQAMGKLGAAYLQANANVMTHCNAGALATGGYGTALGVIRAAFAENKLHEVIANETRPWLQGSRLTAWELLEEGIPVDIVCDSAAASAMQQRNIDWVIVGADRVAANGDVANKIGTFSLAIAARHLGKKFMVVAPTSTLDMASKSGLDIEIEMRNGAELTEFDGKKIAAENVATWNPVFDITPAELVNVLVTEKGAIERPNQAKISALLDKK